jgi:hypothetical protein
VSATKLEQLLADTREDLPAIRKGSIAVADAIEEFITLVDEATKDMRTFVSEKEAVIRSDKSVPWLRARFPQWERQGNARHNPTNPRERQYLLLILPIPARIGAARADAVETARKEA